MRGGCGVEKLEPMGWRCFSEEYQIDSGVEMIAVIEQSVNERGQNGGER